MRQGCYQNLLALANSFHRPEDEELEARLYRASAGAQPVATLTFAPDAQPAVLKFRVEIAAADRDAVRAELWRVNRKTGFQELQGFTNPVYLNH
jgi:hypothetical protein